MKIRKEVDLHSLPTDNNRIKIQINLIKVVQIFVLVLLGPRYYGNAEIPIKKSANFSGNFRTSQFFSLFFAISNLFRPSCVLYGSKQHIVPRPYTHTHTGRDGNERQIDCRYGDVPSWRTWSVSLFRLPIARSKVFHVPIRRFLSNQRE